MNKQQVLKLNKNFLPISVSDWRKVMVDIFSGAVHPVDVTYATDEEGNVDLQTVEGFEVIRSFKEWMERPIRPYDEYVNTPNRSFKIPPVVVCSSFNKIIFKKVQFPTKANIWKRDNYTCQYTGDKLTKDQLSIDHIIPVSRGGKNTWENLVCASKEINVWKSNRTPEECGLKLLRKPFKPNNGLVFDFLRDEWQMFLHGGDFTTS